MPQRRKRKKKRKENSGLFLPSSATTASRFLPRFSTSTAFPEYSLRPFFNHLPIHYIYTHPLCFFFPRVSCPFFHLGLIRFSSTKISILFGLGIDTSSSSPPDFPCKQRNLPPPTCRFSVSFVVRGSCLLNGAEAKKDSRPDDALDNILIFATHQPQARLGDRRFASAGNSRNPPRSARTTLRFSCRFVVLRFSSMYLRFSMPTGDTGISATPFNQAGAPFLKGGPTWARGSRTLFPGLGKVFSSL